MNRRDAIKTIIGAGSALAVTPILLTDAFADDAHEVEFAELQNPVKAEKLAEGMNLISGAGGNIIAMTTAGPVLMIDCGLANQKENLGKVLSEAGLDRLDVLINTHHHGDHTGNNVEIAGKGARIIAHENTRKRVSTEQKNEFFNRVTPPLPEGGWPLVTFSKEMSLHLGGEEVVMTHLPIAHTDNDIVIYFRKANVLHCGDLFFNGNFPVIDYSAKGWVGGMAMAAGKMLAMVNDDTKIVPGHGNLAKKAELMAYHEMLKTVVTRLEPHAKAGKPEADVIAAKPLEDLNEKWGKGRINAEVFTRVAYISMMRNMGK